MTGTGGTEVITRVMDLRSHSKPETSPAEKDISVKEEEEEANDALICAEEKLMEDEEINSVDDFGNPVADAEKIEDRMMTVALARSVIETSGGALSGDTGDTDGAQGQHRYGLRTRRSPSSRVASLTPEQPPSTRKQPPEVSVTRAKHLRTHSVPMVKTATSNPLLASPPPLSVVPLVKPSSLTGPHLAPRIAQRGSATLRTPIHTSHGVPNPLANFVSPSMQQPAPGTSSSLSRYQPTTSGSHPTTVPCPLSAVASPLPAPAPSAEMLPEAATELIPRRGRIFSIDIDPAGLDFPDMTVENIATDFNNSPSLPPLPSSGHGRPTTAGAKEASAQEHVSHPGASEKSGSTDTPAFSGRDRAFSTDFSFTGGRDRAMSFEFFSLGINAEEPLPPAPDFSSSADHHFQQRPRGDSIIFDPISFQDGGIHEEKALMKSRASSIDMQSPDEMAIMNTPGFSAPPTAPTAKPIASHKPLATASFRQQAATDQKPSTQNNAQMATLPSSLNTSMNHATFQMDLLNKDGRIGIYLPEARRARIAKFHSKRKMRIWRKRIKYDCRKKLADSRPRIKGRFVKRSDMDDELEM